MSKKRAQDPLKNLIKDFEQSCDEDLTKMIQDDIRNKFKVIDKFIYTEDNISTATLGKPQEPLTAKAMLEAMSKFPPKQVRSHGAIDIDLSFYDKMQKDIERSRARLKEKGYGPIYSTGQKTNFLFKHVELSISTAKIIPTEIIGQYNIPDSNVPVIINHVKEYLETFLADDPMFVEIRQLNVPIVVVCDYSICRGIFPNIDFMISVYVHTQEDLNLLKLSVV